VTPDRPDPGVLADPAVVPELRVRIAPLEADELDDVQRELLGPTRSGPADSADHLYRTLVRHPGLFRRWVPFAGKLLAGKLAGRYRELLILRTGWRCQAAYEWGQHVIIGRRAGLGVEEIERVKLGPDAAGWSAHDAALLRTADELHDTSRLSDATWAELAATYDHRQLVEILMVVGHYHMVSYVLNGLGIQREPGVPGLF
jgi:4-carboxymuconolactone decarboxylase